MTRALPLAALLILTACAADAAEPEAGDDDWELIEDIEDPDAITEAEWEDELALADVPDPDEPEDQATADEEEEAAIASPTLFRAGVEPESAGEAGVARAMLGSSDPGPRRDPCKNPPSGHVIKGTQRSETLTGGPHRDIIYGYGGDDHIDGGGGNDIICAGYGRDVVRGGPGDDYIDLGAGNDIGYGEGGDDLIHGRAGSDVIHGNQGADELHGDLLDDDLYGDRGPDILIGGHGNDVMYGGAGNDYLRGDTNRDVMDGGHNRDTVSFMTAMPPGQRLADVTVTVNGIRIVVGHDAASGDGAPETVKDVEVVVGSAFDDYFRSGDASTALFGGTGDDVFDYGAGVEPHGGSGRDTCNSAECEPGMEAPEDRSGVVVYVDHQRHENGLVVMGTGERDVIDVLMRGQRAHVTVTGGTIVAGDGCHPAGSGEVACDFDQPFRYLMAWGGNGDDTVRIGGGFPRDFTSHVGGGPGSDHLFGGPGQDVFFSGVDGRDRMFGDGGDDALISESPPGPSPRGEDYGGDPDFLSGGDGNDQLVSDYPCGQHTFRGGKGLDIAGFARVGTRFGSAHERYVQAIFAQLGGRAHHREPFYGHAYQPRLCAFRYATTISGTLEVLEGAGGDDVLHGNDRANFVWGWGGNDRIYGHGGSDVLMGLNDDDHIFGDEGADRLRGGKGHDVLDARDDGHDAEIDCGFEGGQARVDRPNDPEPNRCEGGSSSGMCGGHTCRDSLGRDICEGARGVQACSGGTRVCTCTASGFARCGACE